MKKYTFIIFLFSLLPQLIFSQNLSHADSISRIGANNIIEKHFDKIIEDDSYVLFSIEDKWYLILIKKPKGYEEYYVYGDTATKINNGKCFNRKQKKQILTLAFDKSLYHKISQGNITYFYYKDKDGRVYGESKLTAIIKPNPINENLYNYLLSQLLCCIDKKSCRK
jgi:hypothetical protein